MSCQIPFCGSCRQKRDSELQAIRSYKAARGKARTHTKGKGRAEWDDESDEDDEEDRWGGGEPGIMKPDITFFGQALESDFDECLFRDREEVDLLVIIGTSLKVAPVSEVLSMSRFSTSTADMTSAHIPHSVPQIFINLTPVSHVQPDVWLSSSHLTSADRLVDQICLLGDADTIVTYLSHGLGWEIPPPATVPDPRDPKQSTTPGVDAVGPRRKSTPKIQPEQVAWSTGVGVL